MGSNFTRHGIEYRQHTEQLARRRENTASGIKTDVRCRGDQGMLAKAFVGERIWNDKNCWALRRGCEGGQEKNVLPRQCRECQAGSGLEPFARNVRRVGRVRLDSVVGRWRMVKKRNGRHRRAQRLGCAPGQIVKGGLGWRIENLVPQNGRRSVNIAEQIRCIHQKCASWRCRYGGLTRSGSLKITLADVSDNRCMVRRTFKFARFNVDHAGAATSRKS